MNTSHMMRKSIAIWLALILLLEPANGRLTLRQGVNNRLHDVTAQPLQVFDCLKGCHCEHESGKLVSLRCDGDGCDRDKVKALAATYWSQLRRLVVSGQKAYQCYADYALYYGYDTIQILEISHSTNIKIDDFSYLNNLRHLKLNNTNLPSSFNSALPNLEAIELESIDEETFNAAHLFSWPNLKSFSLTHSPTLVSVVLRSTGDLTIPINDTFGALERVRIASNPNLVSVCPWAVKSAPQLINLDLSNNPKLAVYPSSFQSTSLAKISFENSSFLCDCHISSSLASVMSKQACLSDNATTLTLNEYLDSCQDDQEQAQPATKITAFVNTPVVLDCGGFNTSSMADPEYMTWVTPIQEIRVKIKTPGKDTCDARDDILEAACVPEDRYLILSRVVYFSGGQYHMRVLQNGSLLIQDFGWRDRGVYQCYGWSKYRGDSVTVSLNSTVVVGLEVNYREGLYNMSLIYGFATAGGFLLITLLAKLIYFLLHNYGCCLFCCCCKNQLPPKARRLKNALDSIEAYRSQQQEKLRENYHQQSDWIRQNCALQMERVRDNYSGQVQNLKDIRQYGSTQLQAVRDQYYEQMQRIRDYSANQLERVHENYIFQRQKLRKFSAQNYLKMRETSKYTRKTMNKVIETLPALYMDLTACRQGLNQRQGSLEWEKDDFANLQTIELGPPLTNGTLHHSRSYNFVDREPRFTCERRSESVYFTPSGTPQREVIVSPSKAVKDPYKAVYQQNVKSSMPFMKNRGKSKSFSSHFLPSYWFNVQQQGGSEVVAVIEHEPSGDDYLDVKDFEDAHEEDRLLERPPDSTSSSSLAETSSVSKESSNKRVSRVTTLLDHDCDKPDSEKQVNPVHKSEANLKNVDRPSTRPIFKKRKSF